MFRKTIVFLAAVLGMLGFLYIALLGLADKIFSVNVILVNATDTKRKVTISNNLQWNYRSLPEQVTLKPHETLHFDGSHHPQVTDAITVSAGGSRKTIKIYGNDTMLSYNDTLRTVTVTLAKNKMTFTVENYNDHTRATSRTQ